MTKLNINVYVQKSPVILIYLHSVLEFAVVAVVVGLAVAAAAVLYMV